MSVKVTFCIYIDDDTAIDDYTIAANLNKYSSALLIRSDPHTGFITIFSPAVSKKRLEITDDIEPLTQRLCFDAVTDLVAYRNVTVSFSTHSRRLRLDTENELVHMLGDYGPTTFLRTELLPALYYCGQRYINLLHSLVKYDPYYEIPAARLKPHAEVARQALERARLIESGGGIY